MLGLALCGLAFIPVVTSGPSAANVSLLLNAKRNPGVSWDDIEMFIGHNGVIERENLSIDGPAMAGRLELTPDDEGALSYSAFASSRFL